MAGQAQVIVSCMGLFLMALGFFFGVLYGAGVRDPGPSHVVISNEHRGSRLMSLSPAVDVEPEVDAPYVLLGVISSPAAFGRRGMLREFAAKAHGPPGRTVRNEFVFGDRFYESPPSAEVQQRLADEATRYGDAVFVGARERLPHVGKATEKSAAWWLSAPLRSRARFFCKTDDDSLIHHAHLAAALAAAEAQALREGSPHVLFSYIRWRGWLPFNRFQACGGGWGGPIDAIRHLEDPKEHCELAEGPFPQGTGQLTCMSRNLALELASWKPFEHFLRVAMARNDFGAPCTTAKECAQSYLDEIKKWHVNHHPGLNMWHHEDAGISYNVWGVVNAKQLRVTVVHMPEKGWIWPWFHPKIAEPDQSARAIMMHKVTPQTLPDVLRHWKVAEPAPAELSIDCRQSCSKWGWKWARRPCGLEGPLTPSARQPWRGFGPPWNHTLCKLDPVEVGWKCCFLSAKEI
jgi:hypothetical protein